MSSKTTPTHSIVEYFHTPDSDSTPGHKCGYCKQTTTNYSTGMWAHTLSPPNYEALINHGWRRSGSYVYKPTNHKICCPMYTIRTKAKCVEISRSQRKVLKRFNKYLVDGDRGGEGEKRDDTINQQHVDANNPVPKKQLNVADTKLITTQKPPTVSSPKLPIPQHDQTTLPKPPTTQQQPQQKKKPHPLKKKHLRREAKRRKLLAKGLDPEEFFTRNERLRVTELSSYFEETPACSVNKFHTKLVRVDDEEEFTPEVFTLEHGVYVKYQVGVHGDSVEDCKESQFRRFLCDNPFNCRGGGDDGEKTPTNGTYHQHYYINNNLFAVGVLDILPTCISSVYFFYDPSYNFLTPGTLGALQEINLVNQLNKHEPSLEYYYLGFYIHNCVKMAYKRKFRPCELVCPVTYEWVGFDGRVEGVLERVAGGFARLSCTGVEYGYREGDVESILLLYNRKIYNYENYVNKTTEFEELKSYVSLVTPSVASNMLLYRSSRNQSSASSSSSSSNSS